jgi:hypothetical protein
MASVDKNESTFTYQQVASWREQLFENANSVAEFSRQTGVILCDNSFPKVPLPSDN